MELNNYEIIIGLEIHCQLKTKSKLFCSCPAEFEREPNINVCPVCLGFPGTLPVLNKRAIELALKLALALNCEINRKSSFARKHYFYPDLPKGYQITQYKEPLAYNGYLLIDNKKIRIRRVHLEEDSGKLIHTPKETLIDFNRAGVPLVEIVTEPDFRSPKEVTSFIEKLRTILIYLDISDADMEKGNLRCEPNISLRYNNLSSERREIKNLNSIKNVYQALEYEIEYQKNLLEKGERIERATLLWNEKERRTEIMRAKEEEEDYRYFPEPDLPSLIIDEEEILKIKEEIKELPEERKNRLIREYNLKEEFAEIIIKDKYLCDYYEDLMKLVKDKNLATNWLINEVLRVLNEKKIKINEFPLKITELATFLNLLSENKIPRGKVKEKFYQLAEKKIKIEDILKTTEIKQEKGSFTQITFSDIEKVIEEVLAQEKEVVEKYKKGKKGVIGYLIGEVVKKLEGKVDPREIREEIIKILEKD
ncbi:MAG: Asp-tRNA(Asn)/Glu-tRNA(Gln) amidotransferase subunit GatB [candidate division WOR-3 bacterium]|nr:Asp-tRNA(Asn)/Glu-tRNA(Gln) amidotransferase subunit GatB [candidate division WOR-3 bacterium]MDW8114005.1 Asp-tRNA(Asn)/Glu-tRNA(Gln) amidotransferase subunit GatB [candidate division WOR-3 bacterium]